MKQQFSNSGSLVARLKQIEQLISRNELPDAAQQLTLLAKAAPQEPRVFLLGARLADAAHNPKAMLQSAVKAYQLAPQWPVASLFLSGILAERGQGLEAMTLATQAVKQATGQTALDPEPLVKAAEIAHRLGAYPQALAWLRQAKLLQPADTATDYKIGLTLSAHGDFTDAVDIFSGLLSQLPDNPALLIARRQAALGAQNMTLAIQDGETLLAQEPANEEHRFYLTIARGETPETQPTSVVALQFNSLANLYDAQQAANPHNTLPQELAQRIRGWYPQDDAHVLDLGCGTGALGVALGRVKGVVVGVDLAEQMLRLAEQHRLYDKLHAVNLLDALRDTLADQYHVIAALDVFAYVGNLASVVPNLLRILLPGGHIVFSCEASAEDDAASYRLSTNLRYTHQRADVQRLMQDAGFKDIDLQDRVLRLEVGRPVAGFLVTAVKPLPAMKKTAARKRVTKNAPSTKS